MSRELFLIQQTNNNINNEEKLLNDPYLLIITLYNLNSGISTKQFYSIYENVYLKNKAKLDRECLYNFSVEKIDIHKEILRHTRNNYDIYTYNKDKKIKNNIETNISRSEKNIEHLAASQQNDISESIENNYIISKNYSYNPNKDKSYQYGISCLYASGGILRDNLLKNIIHILFTPFFISNAHYL